MPTYSYNEYETSMETASLLPMEVEISKSIHAHFVESIASYGEHWTPPACYQTFGFPSPEPYLNQNIAAADIQMDDRHDVDNKSELDLVDMEQERLLRQRVAASFTRAQRHLTEKVRSPKTLSFSSKKEYPSPTLRRVSEARQSRASPSRATSRPRSASTVAGQEDTQMKEIITQMENASLSDNTVHYADSSSSDTDVSDDYEESDDDDDVVLATQSTPTFSPLLKPATWSTREMTEGAIYRLTNSLEKMSVRAEGRASRRARPY